MRLLLFLACLLFCGAGFYFLCTSIAERNVIPLQYACVCLACLLICYGALIVKSS